MPAISHILVPTDFSSPAAAAVTYAVELARKLSARITVLHVMDRARARLYGPRLDISRGARADVVAGFGDEASESLERLVSQAARSELAVDSRIAFGDAALKINKTAAELDVDLVVIGTHGFRGLQRVVRGSVTEQVLRAAVCPVLAAPTSGFAPVPALGNGRAIQTLLAAIDSSRVSSRVLELASSLALTFDARVELLHVSEPGVVATFPFDSRIFRELGEHVLKLRSLHIHADYHYVTGLIGDRILATADEVAADMIVMGTHGRRGLRRVLLGSVTETVLRRARCPIVTPPPERGEPSRPTQTHARGVK